MFLLFLRNNRTVFLGMFLGIVAGYFYWFYFAVYWGSYPLSSESWTNCIYGCLLGGFLSCLIRKK